MQTFFNILLVALLIYQLYNFYQIYKAPTILPHEAKKLLNKQGVFFIDVRTKKEFENRHIKGAKNIPLNHLKKRITEIPKDVKIIVVCQSGARSARGTMQLLKSGFKNVYSLKGGMLAWK